MKFGMRTPSLTKRFAARTSLKRYVRHSMGLKAPRGFGTITNPKRALYNRVYNRTTFGIGDLFKTNKSQTKQQVQKTQAIQQSLTPVTYDLPFALRPASFIQLIHTKPASGKDGMAGILFIVGLISLAANPVLGILLLIGGFYWSYTMSKKPWYKEKQALVKAKKEIRAGENENAEVHLREAYAIAQDNPDTLYMLGTVLLMNGKPQEALLYLEVYNKLHPADLDAQLVLAYSLYQVKKTKEAAALLQKFPQEYPDYLLVILLLGDCFLGMKEYEMAIEVFNRGPVRKTNLDSYLLELHYLLGSAYKGKGDKKRAMQQFQRVYSVDMGYKEVAKEIESQ